MNKELFDSMQKQMTPSPQVRAALMEKLAQPVKKRPVPWKKYGALAACAALVIGAFPLYQAMKNPDSSNGQEILWTHRAGVPLHSYATVEGSTEIMPENDVTTETGGAGDQDMGMTPQDLKQAMLDVGYTPEEIDEYRSIGYQMTWAKWWKFVGEQRNSEGDDPFNLDNLKTFSQKELFVNTGALPAPNTGDLPGGAYIGDAPSQEEAVNAYQKLMDHFNGAYPDWYGGAYIDDSGRLVVQLVESEDPGDKSLELQVLDWTDDGHVIFSSCKYSLAHLNRLMDELNALPDADMKYGDVMAGWGTDEEHNRIELTLTQVYDPLLAVLAELDPDDDAICVQVGQRASADIAREPSVIGEDVRTNSAKTEDPAAYHVIQPDGTTIPVPDDEDLIAVEPYYDGADYDLEPLPEKLPAHSRPAGTIDSVPEEDESASTPSFDPNSGFSSPSSGSQS